MTQVMKGVRVLEVAQFTFVPAAGAILADWGADVIKIEHPVRGDTQRGFVNIGGIVVNPQRSPFVEHPNRGKRSVGVDISTPEGMEVIYELARTADVFLTNYLPHQRQKMKFDVEHIRAVNPNIIYARGSAYGDKGAERDTGGFDGTAFWSRSGIGYTMSPEELGGPLAQAIPAFGDSIGGMNIAGGIAAALFHRARTGEAVEVDVSLLSTAWWASGTSIDMGLDTGTVLRNRMPHSGGNPGNPLAGNYGVDSGLVDLRRDRDRAKGEAFIFTCSGWTYLRRIFYFHSLWKQYVGLLDVGGDAGHLDLWFIGVLFDQWGRLETNK